MRADLLAVTEQALVELANRGLVKRATRDLDAGAGPELTDDDGTITGRFPDGTETVLAQGKDAVCTCGAPGACRHRVAVILAYQRAHAAPEPEFTPWSPGDLADELAAGVLTKAQRAITAGLTVRLHRPTPQQPVPTADLGNCTVRFLVPGQLAHARADGTRPDAVALAVLAFREADERGLAGDDVELALGGGKAGHDMTAAVDLATRLLLDGAAHAGTSLAATVARAEAALAELRYPLAAVADLTAQLAAYRARAADHRPERVAELLAELHARHRAVANGGATPAARVLGSDEPAETPLRLSRLTGLGARITGTAADRTAEVYLAGPGGTVLVLRNRWESTQTGAELAGRRVAGASLAQVAAGHLLSESAVRSASRVVRVGRGGKSSVVPSNGGWDTLADGLLVRRLADLDDVLAHLPPRLVRPRVAAEHVHVLAVAEVLEIGYHPGDQRLDAVIADEDGARALVSATYRSTSPGALDALDDALRAAPRFVAGAVRRTRGTLVVDPTALVVGATVVVPDLAPGDGSAALDSAVSAPVDAVTLALDTALGVCAEAAHRGLLHLPAGFAKRVDAAADDLREAGLPGAAATLTRFAEALVHPADAVARWVDAQVRLTTTADAR